MQLTTQLVKAFEQDQQTYGTDVALYNLLWLKATEDLRALGVTGKIHAQHGADQKKTLKKAA